jgi:hypothetical protein
MLSIIKTMALVENRQQLRYIADQGTFTATANSTLDVASSRVNKTSLIVISLNTVGGTILGHPYLMTLTAGTGFGVRAGASDTSVYNYVVWNKNT